MLLLQIIAYNLREEYRMLKHAARKAAGIKIDSDEKQGFTRFCRTISC